VASVVAHTLDYLDDGADVTFKRIAPLSGLVFVVLIVVTFVVLGGGGSTPHNGASGAAIASFYTHHHTTAITATFVLAVAVVPLLAFAATCLPVLQQRSRIWATVFLGGAIASATCLLVTAGTHYALAQGAHNNLDPAALQAINAIDQPAADAFAALAIMVLGAAGALIPNEQRLLRYLGYVAVVLAIIGLSPAGTTLFPLTAIWIAILSVTLGVRADPTRDNVDRGTVPQPA
jgi:hypothetical protein